MTDQVRSEKVEKREWEAKVFVGPANSPALPTLVAGPRYEYKDTGSPDFEQIDQPEDFRVNNADYTEQVERELAALVRMKNALWKNVIELHEERNTARAERDQAIAALKDLQPVADAADDLADEFEDLIGPRNRVLTRYREAIEKAQSGVGLSHYEDKEVVDAGKPE